MSSFIQIRGDAELRNSAQGGLASATPRGLTKPTPTEADHAQLARAMSVVCGKVGHAIDEGDGEQSVDGQVDE